MRLCVFEPIQCARVSLAQVGSTGGGALGVLLEIANEGDRDIATMELGLKLGPNLHSVIVTLRNSIGWRKLPFLT
jgi:hypothetical protein